MIIAHRWHVAHVLHYVGWPIALLFAWDLLIAVSYTWFGQKWVAVNDLPTPLIGSALALLISLRNNNAYARWWEARTLWGGIVNNSRTLARQVRLFLPDSEAATYLIELQIAYVHALRCALRKQDPLSEITALVPAPLREAMAGSRNVPDALLTAIADRLSILHRAGTIDTIAMAQFDGTLAMLGNMQGGAERIKNTPLPRQYTIFPRVFVRIFCILLPLAQVTDLGIATPLGSTMVGFLFLALDRVGADLENPFENDIYDVPLTSITRTIEINLRQALGMKNVPAPLEATDGVLW
jgi:putative membrane protein